MKKSLIDVNGMTIDDLMNISPTDLVKLNTQDVKAIAMRLNSAANKRLNRIKNTNSPSKRDVKFSVKGKTRNQSLREITKAKNFLDNKTSTKSGWEKVKRDTINRFNEKSKLQLNETQQTKFWDVFHKLQEYGITSNVKDPSDKLLMKLKEWYINEDPDGRYSADHIFEEAEEDLITPQYEENVQDELDAMVEDIEDTNEIEAMMEDIESHGRSQKRRSYKNDWGDKF